MKRGSRLSFMYLGYKAYASGEQKARLLTSAGGCFGLALLAEVKREGFYEAVTADKVSLSPHRRVYSGTVPKWLFDGVYLSRCRTLSYFLSATLARRDFAALYLKPFTRPFPPPLLLFSPLSLSLARSF